MMGYLNFVWLNVTSWYYTLYVMYTAQFEKAPCLASLSHK